MTCCTKVSLEGGGWAIVCGKRRHVNCRWCTKPHTLLCDWKMPQHKDGTCSAPMCAEHAVEVAPEKHLCALHKAAYDQWLKLRPAVAATSPR